MAKLSSLGHDQLWVHCALCTHFSWWAADKLLTHVGRDGQVSDIERILGCANCGRHHAEIRFIEPKSDPKRLQRYRIRQTTRRRPVKVLPYRDPHLDGRAIDPRAVTASELQAYRPGSAEALTLTEGADQIAYCFKCKSCGLRQRLDLRLAASRLPPETQVGDLKEAWPCERCGDDAKKEIMTLWLRATTTTRMLEERGYPVWEGDDGRFK